MAIRRISVDVDLRTFVELRRKLSVLRSSRANRAVREGLRAGTVPFRAYIKSIALSLRTRSRRRQSTGATARALLVKTRYPGRDKHRGYSAVSVDLSAEETHFKHTKSDRREAGRRRPAVKLYGLKTNKRTGTTRIVRSYQLSSARIYRHRRQRAQSNVPKNYWHIINNGFNRGNASFPGYRMVADAARRHGEQAQRRLVGSIQGFLRREWGR